MHVNKVQSHGG